MHRAGPVTFEVSARWMLNLTSTVAFAHRLTPPLVHRDLKPANILLGRDHQNQAILRITDFGISDVAAAQAIAEESQPGSMATVAGTFTLLYASPQQIAGQKADPRDDIHALGVIWLQMLTGDLSRGRPGGRGWRRQLEGRGVPSSALDLLEACFDDVPDERPADAGQLAARIDTLVRAPQPMMPPPQPAVKEFAQPQKSAPVIRPVTPLSLPCEITNSIGMRLMLIPAGKFLMGYSDEQGERVEKPQHEVEITRPFYLGAFQVTQEEYERIMGTNPSWFSSSEPGKDKVMNLDTRRFPVEHLTWDEAVEFCRRLSVLAEENKAGRVYRLPTEAEWEYACRGGDVPRTVFAFGDSLSSSQANFDGRWPYGDTLKGVCLGRPTTVGSYKPNALGLFDMHGNVYEWCSDWYANYSDAPCKDPQGPRDYYSHDSRIARGGSWCFGATACRSAARHSHPPDRPYNNIGFRVVCVPATRRPSAD
jgi:formylglycine-generating enzyme required for sulfatase activity